MSMKSKLKVQVRDRPGQAQKVQAAHTASIASRPLWQKYQKLPQYSTVPPTTLPTQKICPSRKSAWNKNPVRPFAESKPCNLYPPRTSYNHGLAPCLERTHKPQLSLYCMSGSVSYRVRAKFTWRRRKTRRPCIRKNPGCHARNVVPTDKCSGQTHHIPFEECISKPWHSKIRRGQDLELDLWWIM